MALLATSSLRPAVAAGPRYWTLFGWFREFRRDPLAFLEQCARRYGGVAKFTAPPITGFVLSDPEWTRHVLERRANRYGKGRAFRRLTRYVGHGILFTDGERWRTGRRLVQPAFTREKLAAMEQPMMAAIGALLERWQRSAIGRGEPFDASREMAKLALDVVGRALLGQDLALRLEEFSEIVTRQLHHANYLVTTAFPLPHFVPTRRNRRARADTRRGFAELDAAISDRRRSGLDRDDLLSCLLAAFDDPECGYMTEQQVRDELLTFLGAGHETTAVTLSWTWYLLSAHPEAEARLHDELERVLGGRAPTFADLAALGYTRRVIDEALRLYPPAWAMGREALVEDEIAGQRVPRGAAVFVSPWVMQRHPDHWEDPERFDPDRFLPERSRGRPRYAYFPFGGGPRRCIGDQFALLELPLVLASVAQRYRLRLVPGQDVTPYPLFTLRPRQGIRMTLEAR